MDKNDKNNGKVYAIVESIYLTGLASSLESENIGGWASVYGTKEAARDGIRAVMRETVNAEYEGSDEDIYIDGILDGIFEDGDEEAGEWYWDATSRSAKWRIIECPVR